MKLQLEVTPDATSDLQAMWDYLAKESIIAADRLIAALADKFRLLQENPTAGKLRDDFSVTMRSFPVKRYIIYYQVIGERLVILRVLHTSRDIYSILS